MFDIPKPIFIVLALLGLTSMIPLTLAVRMRVERRTEPPIHVFLDMDVQESYKPQERNILFKDNRAMRPSVEGTVARGELDDDDLLWRGKEGGEFADKFPYTITEAVLDRGREKYEIFCSVCHGSTGYGDGLVAQRAERLALTPGSIVGWVAPLSFHSDELRTRPAGNIYNTITNGIRTMPAYKKQISVSDRWAIVAWVRTLQESQNGTLGDAPAAIRGDLSKQMQEIKAQLAAGQKEQ